MTSKLVFLNAQTHAGLQFTQLSDYSFAAKHHHCPLLASEIYAASIHYPVLFPVDDPVIPHAVFSLEQGSNPFIADDGSWNGGYLPLQYRRYPFYLGREQDSDTTAVMFDESAPHFNGDDGKPLFTQDGEQSTASPLLEKRQVNADEF